jgi:hypothetical protein
VAPADLADNARDLILTEAPDVDLGGLADLARGRDRTTAHDAVLGNVLLRWLRQDPVAATFWLNENEVAQEVRDQVSLRLVCQCDGLDRPAETAMAWARNISDAKLRFQAMTSAAREMAADDPEAAAAAIRQTPVLSADERQSLLATLSMPPVEPDFPPPD